MIRYPKRDIIFQPGSGGHFLLYLVHTLTCFKSNNPVIHNKNNNEYNYEHNRFVSYLTNQSKKRIFEILVSVKNEYRIKELKSYIDELFSNSNYNSKNNQLNFDELTWLITKIIEKKIDIDSILKGNYFDSHIPIFGELLVSKNDPVNFTIQDEKNRFGEERFGFFHSTINEISYAEYETDCGFSWSVSHLPFHCQLGLSEEYYNYGDYKYVSLISGSSYLFTNALKDLKHNLRDTEHSIINTDIENGLLLKYNPKFYRDIYDLNLSMTARNRLLSNVIEFSYNEIKLQDATSKYAVLVSYYELFHNKSATEWFNFFDTFNLGNEFIENKNEIMEIVTQYHENNLKLLRTQFTEQQIDFMLSAMI